MSDQITKAFVKQYSANVMMLTQQQGSILRGTVEEEPINGKEAYFEQIGAVVAQQRTGRHTDVVYSNTPHDRRKLTTVPYWWADLVDDPDKVRALIDPTSSYAKAGAWAMGRSVDDIIIAAIRGSAWTGEDGLTEVVLPSGQKIADTFGGGGSVGLTLAKLLETKRILDNADVPTDLEKTFAVTATQLSNLLSLQQVTSSDYASIKALVSGQIGSFLGFNFVIINRLPLISSGIRACVAYTRMGVKLGVGTNPIGRISEIPTKGYSVQVFFQMDLGATRMEEVQVVEVACKE